MFEKISVVFPLSRANSVHMRFEKEPTKAELKYLNDLVYQLVDIYQTPEEKAEAQARVAAYVAERDAAQ